MTTLEHPSGQIEEILDTVSPLSEELSPEEQRRSEFEKARERYSLTNLKRTVLVGGAGDYNFDINVYTSLVNIALEQMKSPTGNQYTASTALESRVQNLNLKDERVGAAVMVAMAHIKAGKGKEFGSHATGKLEEKTTALYDLANRTNKNSRNGSYWVAGISTAHVEDKEMILSKNGVYDRDFLSTLDDTLMSGKAYVNIGKPYCLPFTSVDVSTYRTLARVFTKPRRINMSEQDVAHETTKDLEKALASFKDKKMDSVEMDTLKVFSTQLREYFIPSEVKVHGDYSPSLYSDALFAINSFIEEQTYAATKKPQSKVGKFFSGVGSYARKLKFW